jgi:hypothetical protein
MKRFHNAPDKRALSVTVLRAVCSADVRAEAPKELREKTDRRQPGFVQEPPSRSSLWADHKRRCNSHSVRRLNCSLGRLGVLATAGQRRGVIMSENETGGAAEAKPRLGSPSIRPQPSVPEITTMDRLRQILATPIYIIALVFDLLSELFTGIAERIDGSSSGYHS